jgi:hypothetical protein
VVIIATAAATVWSLLRMHRQTHSFAGGFALVTLIFFCLNKQAFVNYYFLVIGAVLLAAVAGHVPGAACAGPDRS